MTWKFVCEGGIYSKKRNSTTIKLRKFKSQKYARFFNRKGHIGGR